MRVLALVRNPEDLEELSSYVRTFTSSEDEICFLNMINVPGDIPTKPNGEVLDFCTEFNLTPYLKEQKNNEEWLSAFSMPERKVSTRSVVGNQYALLKEEINSKRIELVITSSAHTSEILDMVKKTKAGILHDKFNVPVLSFKDKKGSKAISNIGIVSDFENPSAYDLSALKNILQRTGGTCALYAFCDDMNREQELRDCMQAFSEHHHFECEPHEIIESSNKEKSARDLLNEKQMDLMVVLDIHRHGFKKALLGNLEADILNHMYTLILAY